MKAIFATIWICILGYGLGLVSNKTRHYATESYRLVEPAPLSSIEPRILNIITLGFRGVYDDFLSIWTIQFLADARLKNFATDEVFAAIKSTTRQRPKIESIYMLSCFVLALDLNRPDLCKEIIIDGMNALPDSWRLPVTQGFIYAYKLNDFANAAIFYSLAASRPGAPSFLKKLSQNMIEKNELSVEDMQTSLLNMFDSAGGSKVGNFLNYMMQKNREKDQPSGN
jgi:hypothetical protein